MNYCRKQDVVARFVAGAHLLVPIHTCTRSIYTLNVAGCQLWDLIETPRTAEELTTALVERYHITQTMAQQDVKIFLDDMVRMGLATVQE